MNEKHIKIIRSMRYYTAGNLDKSDKLWVLIHGHGQLAGKFIQKFKDLIRNGNFLVAPEGLMRFYLHGSHGEVGASWMTKEDREYDIGDYVNYLDKVLETELSEFDSDIKVYALGFSQGAATLSRWLAYGNSKISRAIFWCGELAHDVDYSNNKFREVELIQVFGSDDKIFPNGFIENQKKLLESAGLKPEVHVFSGGHEINVEIMKEAGLI